MSIKMRFSYTAFLSLKGGKTRGLMLKGHVAGTCCSDKKNLCSAH